MLIKKFNIPVFEFFNLVFKNASQAQSADDLAYTKFTVGKYLPGNCSERTPLWDQLLQRYQDGGKDFPTADPDRKEGVSVPKQIIQGGAFKDPKFGINFASADYFTTDIMLNVPTGTYTTVMKWERPGDVVLFHPDIFEHLMMNYQQNLYNKDARQFDSGEYDLEPVSWSSRMLAQEPHKRLAERVAKACYDALKQHFAPFGNQYFDPLFNARPQNDASLTVFVGNIGPAVVPALFSAVARVMDEQSSWL